MKKIIIYVLFSTMLLTGCVSKTEVKSDKISNIIDKETTENTSEEGENDTINSTEGKEIGKIIDEVKNYILYGQQDKPEASKLKWSERFLNEVDIEALYNDFLKVAVNKDDVKEFAKYITENEPILNNWEDLFKKDVLETYKEDIVSIKQLDGDMYIGNIMVNGVETAYVTVSSRTGYYHGTSGSIEGAVNSTSTALTKEKYLGELDKLKSDLEASFKKRYESPVTVDLIQAASDEYKLWDDKLNEIYSEITKQLSPKDIDSLIADELEWIKIRDEKSQEAGKTNEGGSIAPLNEAMSLIQTTRDRCYELVNKYMK